MSAANVTVVEPGSGGAMPVMWVPCVVFAHLFAAYFLLGMLSVMYPSTWQQAKARIGLGGGSKGSSSSRAGSAAAASKGGNEQQLAAMGSKGGAKALPPAGAQDQDPELGLHGDSVAAVPAHAVGMPAHSVGSQALIHKLTALVRPMVMQWEDVGCAYNTSTGVKTVLQGVWGRADPGDMVALMGPSGAGKSTLMDILAGRKSVGTLTGHVLVNGQRRRSEQFRKRTAYVPQEDNFLPTMNVQETCSFYATVLLRKGTSKAVRQERIAEVLAAMGLSHTTETLVGGTLPGGIVLRGLSGGERKRLSIATGIMSTPCIVFLDEPTSGLDSFAALSVMSYMRGMASAGGQTVISSIHQPRAAIWALFDKAALLSMGRMMYFGPREGLVPWFTKGCGYPYDPAMHGLASDWVMDLVNIGFKKPESLFGKMMNTVEELEGAADAFSAKYLAEHAPSGLSTAGTKGGSGVPPSTASKPLSGVLGGSGSHAAAAGDAGSSTAGDSAGDADQASRDQLGLHDSMAASTVNSVAQQEQQARRGWFGRKQASSPEAPSSASWLTQCRILLWREFLSVTRNPADVAGRCLIFTWLAMFVGLIFYNLPTTVDGLRARMNVLFVEPVILLLLPYVYMSLFTSDKQYFIADVSAKLYRPSAYYVAKQLAVLPFAVLNSLLFTFVLYGMAGLRHDASAVGMNATMSMLMYLCAAQVLTLTAVVMPNEDLAFMGAIAWTAINLLLSNFMVRYVDMTNRWLSYLRYLSAMGYAFDGYGQAEFSNIAYSCANGLAPSIVGFLPQFLPNTPAISSPLVTRTITAPGPSCIVDLDSIIAYFNLFRPFWQTCVILAAYLIILHLATFGGLLQLTKKERR